MNEHLGKNETAQGTESLQVRVGIRLFMIFGIPIITGLCPYVVFGA
jgi:hypothetical protein